MKVYEILSELVKKRISDDISNKVVIKKDTLLIEDLGYDSLSFIQLLVDIEDRFNIEIDEIDFEEHDMFINLVNYIEKQIK
ncbi:acyl carrier protein [Thomasclavelia cocleata]|uniref:acyl carrier protein n=1 Tax=Thomasclavelia cocleata TaxID=69824 RepID=UPI00272DD387|nr:phosphopantetheine-binding protein [Thomasclavelia cocleata]